MINMHTTPLPAGEGLGGGALRGIFFLISSYPDK